MDTVTYRNVSQFQHFILASLAEIGMANVQVLPDGAILFEDYQEKRHVIEPDQYVRFQVWLEGLVDFQIPQISDSI